MAGATPLCRNRRGYRLSRSHPPPKIRKTWNYCLITGHIGPQLLTQQRQAGQCKAHSFFKATPDLSQAMKKYAHAMAGSCRVNSG
jgi:hypothetical protein